MTRFFFWDTLFPFQARDVNEAEGQAAKQDGGQQAGNGSEDPDESRRTRSTPTTTGPNDARGGVSTPRTELSSGASIPAADSSTPPIPGVPTGIGTSSHNSDIPGFSPLTNSATSSSFQSEPSEDPTQSIAGAGEGDGANIGGNVAGDSGSSSNGGGGGGGGLSTGALAAAIVVPILALIALAALILFLLRRRRRARRDMMSSSYGREVKKSPSIGEMYSGTPIYPETPLGPGLGGHGGMDNNGYQGVALASPTSAHPPRSPNRYSRYYDPANPTGGRSGDHLHTGAAAAVPAAVAPAPLGSSTTPHSLQIGRQPSSNQTQRSPASYEPHSGTSLLDKDFGSAGQRSTSSPSGDQAGRDDDDAISDISESEEPRVLPDQMSDVSDISYQGERPPTSPQEQAPR